LKIKNWWKNKEKINIKEVIIRYLIIIVAGVISAYSDNDTKQWINVIAFGSGLIFTFYMRKHFFPLMTASLFCYFSASVNELFEPSYRYTPFTITLWNIGNLLLPIALLTFISQITFTYKIIKRKK
jgi:hypothetical protein